MKVTRMAGGKENTTLNAVYQELCADMRTLINQGWVVVGRSWDLVWDARTQTAEGSFVAVRTVEESLDWLLQRELHVRA